MNIIALLACSLGFFLGWYTTHKIVPRYNKKKRRK